jgi:RimJ/RimL family protein N-acetyltransferase
VIEYIHSDQDRLLQSAKSVTGSDGFASDAHALGVMRDKALIAVAVFENHTQRKSEVHFGATHPAWRGRKVQATLYGYAFDYLHIPRLIAPIPAWNTTSQVTALKSGFVFCGFEKSGACDGSDAIRYPLTRKMCRWLPPTTQDETTEG